jgi:hypothetical protein
MCMGNTDYGIALVHAHMHIFIWKRACVHNYASSLYVCRRRMLSLLASTCACMHKHACLTDDIWIKSCKHDTGTIQPVCMNILRICLHIWLLIHTHTHTHACSLGCSNRTRSGIWSYTYTYVTMPAGEGTVSGPGSSEGWVRVNWDRGGSNSYRFGASSAYDLIIAQPITSVRPCYCDFVVFLIMF